MSIENITAEEFSKLFDLATDVASIGYWEWDIRTNEVLWSRQKIEIYGEDADDFQPTFEKFLTVIDQETRQRVMQEIELVLKGEKQYYDLQHEIALKNGKHAWVHEKAFVIRNEDQEPVRMIGIVRDITDDVKREEKLTFSTHYVSYLEEYDQLTGLKNKNLLFSDLRKIMDADSSLYLLFLDIDNFRTLNNSYGHLFGDRLLRSIASKLSSLVGCIRVYRYGADEFAIIVEETCDNLEKVLSTIERIFSVPLIISGVSVQVRFSTGIAHFPQDTTDLQTLVKNANIALQVAKSDYTSSVVAYDNKMSEVLAQQQMIFENLEIAVRNESFIPYFQPKVNSETEKIVSFEALARWEIENAVIAPAFFLSIAKEKNLISEIDRIILKKTLAQLQLWHELGYEVEVSVNFTSKDFQNKGILALLDEYTSYLSYLTIEITENDMMNIEPQLLSAINAYRKKGIRISLDDFGTGYSSLHYLHSLPIDELKIDKLFVDGIPYNKNDADLVRIIKSIVDTFSFDCVVEGVEKAEQKAFFQDLGLNIIQGYIYARPMEGEAATILLSKGKTGKTVR